MTVLEETITKADPRAMVARRVGRIPEDRHAVGVVGEMTVWENLASEEIRAEPVSRQGFFLDRKAARERAEAQIEAYDIRCKGPGAETRLLSGGNMQKLILARALSYEPRIIVANQPARGLDEGAIAYVHERLLQARKAGAGILLISEDLDELLALADRIAVIYRGQLQAPFRAHSVGIRDIGLMMSGQGHASGAA